jgi:signal peptidase I
MMPTLNDMGDIALVDKISMNWDPLRRGDVVVADSTDGYETR